MRVTRSPWLLWKRPTRTICARGRGGSPAQRLFGARARTYGDLYDGGMAVGWHRSAVLRPAWGSERRTKTRQLSTSTRSCWPPWRPRADREQREPGQRVFLYRQVKQSKKKDVLAQEGCYVEPAVVVGPHGPASAWAQYGSRLFLVALEHMRSMTFEQEAMDTPQMQQALREVHKGLGKSARL